MPALKWTTENTEGFSDDDLATMNEAQQQLEARFPGVDPGNIGDMLNNAFTHDLDARQLERIVARRLSPLSPA